MTLYEINEALLNLVDPETGELEDIEAFERLGMEKDKKLEGVGCWIKDLKAEAEALDNEIKILRARKTSAENKMERLKGYLDYWLQGSKFSTSKVSVSYRKSTATVVDEDHFIAWAMEHASDLLKYKTPEVNKTAIKEAIEDGRDIEYAQIIERQNISIK